MVVDDSVVSTMTELKTDVDEVPPLMPVDSHWLIACRG